ncbi:MAG: iron-containing alcohol dehydrogenase [Rhodospirillaceae bacterium]
MDLKRNWNYPTTIWTGPGRLADLREACVAAKIGKPLIVTDRGLAANEMIARARAMLNDAPAFSDIQGNPVQANLDAGLALYKHGAHDGVVAIGGGSALDIGKLIAFMAGQSRPIWDFEDIGDWWTRADADAIAPVVAVPTTAGTGSEVGRAAVITHPESHEKKIIFHPKMMPRIVISDPELTVGLPPRVTVATGMDAFVHCFEAYCAPGFHPLADGIALEGMRLVKDYLPRAVDNGRDIEARAMMLAAASMGATAFQKGLGAVHALAHPVGAIYDTHHGMTNAVILPYVIAFNKHAIVPRISAMARTLDLADRTHESLMAWVVEFRRRLKVPSSLRDLGVGEDKVDLIAQMAAADPSAGGNPAPVTVADFARIFRAAVRGDLSLGS